MLFVCRYYFGLVIVFACFVWDLSFVWVVWVVRVVALGLLLYWVTFWVLVVLVGYLLRCGLLVLPRFALRCFVIVVWFGRACMFTGWLIRVAFVACVFRFIYGMVF